MAGFLLPWLDVGFSLRLDSAEGDARAAAGVTIS
jgi:hypothetical protein